MMGNILRKTFNSKVSRTEQFRTYAKIGEKVIDPVTNRVVNRLVDDVPKVGRMAALDIVSAVGVLLDEEKIRGDLDV